MLLINFAHFDSKMEMADIKPPLSAISMVIDSIGCDHTNQQMDDRMYHESCIKCSICETSLESQCFSKNGQLFCNKDYYKEHSSHTCAGCLKGISPTDMVYKLRAGLVFHVDCHCCSTCGRQLSPGEQILVNDIDRTVSCFEHSTQMNYPTEAICDMNASCSSSQSTSNFDDKFFQFNPEFEIKKEIDPYGYSFEPYSFSDFCDGDSRMLKRRGPRTTIKQNQLDVLNEMFLSTPKPSKHARAKLALETGLSMRVIQNRRSKERRLKHLCNYLRHYEQRGLIPPTIHFRNDDNDGSELGNFMGNFDEEEDDD